jgi:hypothetical protein
LGIIGRLTKSSAGVYSRDLECGAQFQIPILPVACSPNLLFIQPPCKRFSIGYSKSLPDAISAIPVLARRHNLIYSPPVSGFNQKKPLDLTNLFSTEMQGGTDARQNDG